MRPKSSNGGTHTGPQIGAPPATIQRRRSPSAKCRRSPPTARATPAIPGPAAWAHSQKSWRKFARQKPVFNHGYDTWCPGKTFTDVLVADWVIQKQPGYKQKYNILSCYTPMKEEDRAYLLNETGSRKIAANVLNDFQKLMPGLDVDPIEFHISRRGHPLYMC